MSSPATPEQERDWIAGLQAGRLDVFQVVFTTYARPLQRFAQVWVAQDVAEDVVQDVLFDVWQRRERLTIHSSLTAYLFAAVRNRVAEYVRHDKVVSRVEQEEHFETPPGMGRGPEMPDMHLVAGDMRASVIAALDALSELQRAALLLRWVHDMSFAQIAAALSISENAAKLHVSRGRQALYPVLKTLLDE